MEEAQELSELGVEWQWRWETDHEDMVWCDASLHPKTVTSIVLRQFPHRVIAFRVRVSPET